MPDLNRRKFLNGKVYPVGEDAIVDLKPQDIDTPWRVARVISDHIVQADTRTILVDTQYHAVQVTIPTAVGAIRPITIRKVNTGGNALTITAVHGQTIEGDLIFTVADDKGYTLVSDNVNWYVWADYNETGGGGGGADVPPGTIVMTGFDAAMDGWMVCDGSAVSRATYANLFDAIGTAFGSGDGSTTFNIPDMQGRFPFGLDLGATPPGSAMGDEFGNLDHTHAGSYVTASAANAVDYFTPGGTQATPGLVSTHTHVITTNLVVEADNPPALTVQFQIKT